MSTIQNLTSIDELYQTLTIMSYVNTVTLVGILIVSFCVMVRKNTNEITLYTYDMNNFAQDLLEFFGNNVVVLMIEYAPYVMFVMSRGRFSSYVYLLNAIILYGLHYLAKIHIDINNEGNTRYDDFGQDIQPRTTYSNGLDMTKLTYARYRISKLLRGSSFSCAVVGLMTLVLDNMNL